jgi:hypothetical protein
MIYINNTFDKNICKQNIKNKYFYNKRIKMKYKDKNTLEKRISESNRICSKYPGYIPVIVEINNDKIKLSKNQFLVPKNVSAGHLLVSIRKQITTGKNEAIFMFSSDNTMICSTTMMDELYQDYLKQYDNRYSENDLFYYVHIQTENTFG